MTEPEPAAVENPSDLWSWLQPEPDQEPPDYSRFRVRANVITVIGGDATTECLAALARIQPVIEIGQDLPPDAAGDWIWVLPDDTLPNPDSLTALLDQVIREPQSGVIGALLVEPRRRGAGRLVSEWAASISSNGRLRLLTEPGELHQGQLEIIPALGVSAGGMLVRGDIWRFLGGLNPDLPRGWWGLDFGWRANLAGYRVIATPDAELIDQSQFDDDAAGRAAGLALVWGNTARHWRWWSGIKLVVSTLLATLVLLLGKDLTQASAEIRGLGRWLTDRRLRRSVTERVQVLPSRDEDRARVRALRLGWWDGVTRTADRVGVAISEWMQDFTGRGSEVSLDELTGDEFGSASGTKRGLPVLTVVLAVLVVASLVANRAGFGTGVLRGTQLLPAPDGWLELLQSYLLPVPGTFGVAGAPWAGLTALFSLLTLGRPDWLLTGLFWLVVPLSWLLAFRMLRHWIEHRTLAGALALAYVLTPALLGGFNAGSLTLAGLTLLLPILSQGIWRWHTEWEPGWARAGAIGFWLLLVVSLAPSLWIGSGLVLVWLAALRPSGRRWLQGAFALAAPALLLLGPWGVTLFRFPGRWLVLTDPALTPAGTVSGWPLLLGVGSQGTPQWLAMTFFAVLWITALWAVLRRTRWATLGLVIAGVAAIAAMVVSSLAVEVLPQVLVRPGGQEWQLLMAVGLLAAVGTGLDETFTGLRGHDLGLRHLGVLLLAAVGVVSVALSAGWWVWDGQSGLHREEVGQVPAFVRNAQTSATPGRTLYLDASSAAVNWSLLEADFPRLGDAERGFGFGGDPRARDLAGSVVARLIGDVGDEQLVPDLIRLGVSQVVLTGGDGHQRQAIDNVPGLELGTGEEGQLVWPVPDSGILTIDGTDGRSVTGNLENLPGGAADRVLQLAEPADPDWLVSVQGHELPQIPGDGPGTGFQLGASGGTLEVELRSNQTLPWVQLAGFLLLALLAAPSLPRAKSRTPRRIAQDAS